MVGARSTVRSKEQQTAVSFDRARAAAGQPTSAHCGAAVKLHRGEVASVSSGRVCGPDEVLVSARGKSHPKATDFPLASMPPDVLQTPEGAGAALVGAVMSASLARERSIEYTDRRRFDR